MVVRLGLTERSTADLHPQRYRILQGQALHLHYVANASPRIRSWARVIYDNGEPGLLLCPDEVITGEGVPSAEVTSSDVARMNGWVTDALVELPIADTIQRGQVYAQLQLEPYGPILCQDYVFSDTGGQISLGTFRPPGPAGGAGHVRVVTVKAEGVPVAVTTLVLRVNNTLRRFDALVWYYEASNDVATRTLLIKMQNYLGASLTGQLANTRVIWSPATLVLTADEDGTVFADASRSGKNDNTTVTIEDITTAPTPFPAWIRGDMPAELTLQFDNQNFHANDLDAIYVLTEEWVMVD